MAATKVPARPNTRSSMTVVVPTASASSPATTAVRAYGAGSDPYAGSTMAATARPMTVEKPTRLAARSREGSRGAVCMLVSPNRKPASTTPKAV